MYQKLDKAQPEPTLGHKSDILTPLNPAARNVLASCSQANLALCQILSLRKQFCLLFLQIGRRFDEIDDFNALHERFEARNSLRKFQP